MLEDLYDLFIFCVSVVGGQFLMILLMLTGAALMVGTCYFLNYIFEYLK